MKNVFIYLKKSFLSNVLKSNIDLYFIVLFDIRAWNVNCFYFLFYDFFFLV